MLKTTGPSWGWGSGPYWLGSRLQQLLGQARVKGHCNLWAKPSGGAPGHSYRLQGPTGCWAESWSCSGYTGGGRALVATSLSQGVGTRAPPEGCGDMVDAEPSYGVVAWAALVWSRAAANAGLTWGAAPQATLVSGWASAATKPSWMQGLGLPQLVAVAGTLQLLGQAWQQDPTVARVSQGVGPCAHPAGLGPSHLPDDAGCWDSDTCSRVETPAATRLRWRRSPGIPGKD